MSTDPSLPPVPAGDPVALASARARGAAAKRPGPPPFGTLHLLLWVACTGAYLAATRQLYVDLPLMGALAAMGLVMPRGAAWAGLCILGWRIWKKSPWPIEPGLWLAATVGLCLLAEVLLTLGAPAQQFDNPTAVQAALACVIFVLPTLSRDLAKPWKCFFLFLLAIWGWPLLMAMSTGGGPFDDDDRLGHGTLLILQGRYYLAAAGLAVVVGQDLVRGRGAAGCTGPA